MKKTITVKGMHCAGCEKRIEQELKKVKGVNEVKANFPDEIVDVEFDESKISEEKIAEKLSEIGYSVPGKQAKKQDKGFLKNLFYLYCSTQVDAFSQWIGRIKRQKNSQIFLYALIPHTGCFAFILITIFGVTGAAVFLRPLLMNAYFFYALILFSFLMTTISVGLYLKYNKIFSAEGVKRKWKYVSTMYGITIGVNLLLFFVIFPFTANIGSGAAGAALAEGQYSLLKISVTIPCPGHAPLITGDLKTIKGVKSVRFNLPSNFDIYYNSKETNKQEILSLEVFKTYPAAVLSESSASQLIPETEQKTQAGCGCSACGGSGNCGK